MSAAKRASKSAVGPLGDLAGWAFGRGRTIAGGLLLIAAFLAAWWWVWQQVGPRVTRAERYLVELDDLRVSPQPEWVRADVPAEVYQSLRLGGPMNLLDDDLSPRIAEEFARHPWIERVVRVTKLSATGVQVEVEYRRPVCVVHVGERLFLVDRRTVLLPAEDVPPAELARLPQLAGIEAPPLAVQGEPWGSVRVAGGAALAADLAEVWEPWNLARILPFRVVGLDGREQIHFSLFTQGGSQIVWGLPPGVEDPSELSAQQKLARLKAYRARVGTFGGPTGSLDLDVRELPDDLR